MELRKEGAGPPLRAGAVLLAAGASSRMGSESSKALMVVGNETVVERSAAALLAAPSVARLVVVIRPEDEAAMREVLRQTTRGVDVEYVRGGEERTDSVRAGVDEMADDVDVIVVHDAARCFVSPTDVEAVVRASYEHGAALLANRVHDTLKLSTNGFQSEETVDRDRFWAAQTPQGMRTARFRDVVARARRDGYRPTDDAALHEHYHGPTRLVEATGMNLKLTTPEDARMGEVFAQLVAKDAGARDGVTQ